MPLSIDIIAEERNVHIGTVYPWQPSGSLSDNPEKGGREIYLFECAIDDSHSALYRSKSGSDDNIGNMRITHTDGLELIARIVPDKPYEMMIKTDSMKKRMKIRFSHVLSN